MKPKLATLLSLLALLLLSGSVHAIQSAAQINPDERVERVTVSEEGVLYAWNKYGDVISGWPIDKRAGGQVFLLPPRLVDIDYDFQDDILAVSEGSNGALRFHVFKGNGTELPYLSFIIDADGGELVSTPTMADVNYDSSPDIVYATSKGKIHVVRPDFSNAPNMLDLNVGGTPRISVGDPDNDGMPNLFAAAGNKIYAWGENPQAPGVVGRVVFYTLASGEEILEDLAITDLTDDGIPEIAFITNKNRLVVLNALPGAPPLRNIQIPSVTATSGAIIGDVDVDGEPEILFATNLNTLYAFNLDGTLVANFAYPLNFSDSVAPSVGLVADDSYTGLLIASTGQDQTIFYRSKLGYSELGFGDYAHFFDPRADLEFVEFVGVKDVLSSPLIFTPNGDGINDNVKFKYWLSMDAHITLDIYDNHHKRIARVFADAPRVKGYNEEIWNGKIGPVSLTTGRYLFKIGAKSADGVYSYGEAVFIAFGVKAEIDTPRDANKKDSSFPTVFGVVDITGTATDPNIGEGNLQADFSAYKLYYRAGDWRDSGATTAATAGEAGSGWLPLAVPLAHQSPKNISNEPADGVYPDSNVSVRAVQHGLLGSFDTTDSARTPNGVYTILVKAVDSNGNDPARLSFDMLVVAVANPTAIGPYDPQDKFDPRNPNNPKYIGPKLTNVELSSYYISNSAPSTTITYEIGRLSDGWGRENAHVEIDVLEYDKFAQKIGSVSAAFLFKNMAPGVHTLNWAGKNSLGKNLPGGDYLVRVTANATDGSGSSSKDAPQALHIEKGFASSDVLNIVKDSRSQVSRFTATPNPLYPYNFDPATNMPEKMAIYYELTKEAKIDLAVFDNFPTNNLNDNNGAMILKNLKRDYVSKAGTVYWDGTNDAGEILATGRPYFVKLIAQDIALGQDNERIAMVIEVALERAALAPITADISALVGKDDAILPDDENPDNNPMIGSPAFFWRGRGVGYLEAGFDYTIGAKGDEWSRENQPALTAQYPLYVQKFFASEDCGNDFLGWDCHTYYKHFSIIGHLDRIRSTMDAAAFSVPAPAYFEQIGAELHTSFNDAFADVRLYIHRSSAGRSAGNNFRILSIPGGSQNVSSSQLHDIFISSRSSGVSGWQPPPDELCTHYTPPVYRDVCKWGKDPQTGRFQCIPTGERELLSGNPEYAEIINSGVLFDDLVGSDWSIPPGYEEGEDHKSQDIWVCGNIEIQAIYSIPKAETWDWKSYGSSVGLIRSDTHNIGSSLGRYLGTIGSGDQGRYGATINEYSLSISNFSINGNNLGGSSNGSTIPVGPLTAWLNDGKLYADLQPHVFLSRDHDYLIDSADNKFPAADWIYVKIAPPGLNDNPEAPSDTRTVNLFSKQTGLINIYNEYLENHQRGQDVGTNLYTFSDIVRITDWSESQLVYPDNTTNDAFVVVNDPRDIDANGTIDTNDTREHNLKFRLKANGNPRNFLEIRGSAANEEYELAYYDSHASEPQWRPIPKAPSRARQRGILGYWDVTDLNGNKYTLRLRVTEGGNRINEDVMNVKIGTPMDLLGGRVYSTFGRASLTFLPESIANDTLVTINTVDPTRTDALDYRLPSGIPPIGPIFDIKPDGIEINRNYPVDLEVTYTCEELRELLTIGPFNWNPDMACNQIYLAHITVYNLAADGILEPLFTDVIYDAGQNNYKFRATLDHFSQYMLGMREAGYFVVTSPQEGEIQKGQIQIQGRIETLPRKLTGAEQPLAVIEKLNVSFYEKGNPASKTVIAALTGGVDPIFNIAWNTQALSGNYVLLFEAEGPEGLPSKYEWQVAIDNTPASSRLIIDGQLIADGGRVRASPNSIVEISSTDGQSDADWQAGLKTSEFSWDNGSFETYQQPFTLINVALGEHIFRYRTIDNKGNVESDQIVTIEVAKTVTINEVGNVELSLSIGNPNYTKDALNWVSPLTQFTIATIRGDVHNIMYSTGDPIFAIYTEPFDISKHEEGLYTLEYYSVDVFGVRSEVKSKQVTLDKTPPVTTLSTEGESLDVNGEIFANANTKFILTARDENLSASGVKRIEYKLGDAAWQTYAGPVAVTATTNLAVRSVDNVENVEEARTFKIRFDDVAPSIVATKLPSAISPNGDGRFDTAEFLFSASDNFAKKLNVDIDVIDANGNRKSIFADQEFEPGEISLIWDGRVDDELLPQGAYIYEIHIEDQEGNPSPALSGQIVLDTTAPTLAIVGSNVIGFTPNGDATNDILSVQFNISDNLFTENIEAELKIMTGGIFEVNRTTKIIFTVPSQQNIAWNGKNVQDNPSFDGSYEFELVATDPAGNRSVPQIGQGSSSKGAVVIDRIPPETKITVSGPSYNEKDKVWVGRGAKIVLDASDPEPGAGISNAFYNLDGGGAAKYNGAFALPIENHDYTLEYWAEDLIGNLEAPNKVILERDTTPPASSYEIADPKETTTDGEIFVGPSSALSFSAQDGEGVGVKFIEARIGGVDQFGKYAVPIKFDNLEDGLHEVFFRSQDYVGNIEETKTIKISVDQTPPNTELVIESPKFKAENSDAIYIDNSTVIKFQATANRDDIAKTEYSFDQKTWTEATPIQIGSDGEQFLYYRSADRLGNVEDAKSQRFVVDGEPPEMNLTFSGGASGSVRFVTPNTAIKLLATDKVVGAGPIEFSIDDGPYQKYTGPFTLGAMIPGEHRILFRAKDLLGHESPISEQNVSLVNLNVSRHDFVLPRVLIYMLQTFDLAKSSPRPNQELMQEILTEAGGYWKVTEDLDEFISLMRSGKFSTYIFATDAYTVDFLNDAKVKRMFGELLARIHKGESFISMIGYSRISGQNWSDFVSNFDQDGNSDDIIALIPDELNDIQSLTRGRGRLLNFGIDLGRADSRSLVKETLENLIEEIRPKEERLEALDIIDTELVFENPTERTVSIVVTEKFPENFSLETKSSGAEVLANQRNYTMDVPALGQMNVNYLLRFPSDAKEYQVDTEVSLGWDVGVTDSIYQKSPYVLEADLRGLLEKTLDGHLMFRAKDPEAVRGTLGRILQRMALDPGVFDESAKVDSLVDEALLAIEKTGKSADSEGLLYELDEIVEGIGLSASKSKNVDLSISPGDVNDPESFHGETTSYTSGGCSLMVRSKSAGLSFSRQ